MEESGLRVRLATHADVEPLLDLLAGGARYALKNGIDMWPERFAEALLTGDIERAELHVVHADDVLVATFTHTFTDRPVWGADDGRASYVHRLAVDDTWRGRGIGNQLLSWAGETGRARGRELLRLDTLHENARLRAWYESIGFTHVRDRDVDVPEGAATRAKLRVSLYERPVTPDGAEGGRGHASERIG